jgi:vitamin K-dependent gamma-carboxylase
VNKRTLKLQSIQTQLMNFRKAIFAPIETAPLALFRILFGALMLVEVYRFLDHGWVQRYFIEPEFYFHYPGLSWLSPLPGDGMLWLFYVLGVLAFMVMVGLFYRVSIVLFTLGFSYQFLIDETQYLNHFYLLMLVALLLCVIPAHANLSLDSRIWPSLRKQFAPAWTLWVLRLQVGIPYFYGGLAKLNQDWLLGEPMRMWLSDRTDYPVVGALFSQEWVVFFFSYGGLIFDLLIVPMLLMRRTRIPAILLVAFFNITNHSLFSIGIFPWFMFFSTFIFLPSHWPGKLFRALGVMVAALRDKPFYSSPETDDASDFKVQPLVTTLLRAYIIIQLSLPLRHFLYPGNPSWSEEGHRFAWHMKLRSKTGTCQFLVKELQSGKKIWVDPSAYLSRRQLRKMSTRPYMIAKFARYLEKIMLDRGHGPVAIYAWSEASLNGRPFQSLVDPEADLLKASWGLGAADWITPLRWELPDPKEAPEPDDYEDDEI